MDSFFHKLPEFSAYTPIEGSAKDSAAGELNTISPLFYVDLILGPAILRALIDSGASANFISERVAVELQLNRLPLHEGHTFTAAS